MIRSLFRRHRAAAVTTLALAALLLTTTVAELAARTLLHNRLTAVAGRALGKGTTVDIEGGPALLALFDRHIDAVTISNDHAALGRIPGVSVRARLEDLQLTADRSGTVTRTHADVTVPAASLQRMAEMSDGRLPVTAVHLDDQADTVTLDLGQGGLGQATLQPRLQNGRVTLHLADVEILGSPAPPRLVDRIQDTLTSRNAADYPLGLKASTLDVTTTGLAVGLEAGPTRLPGKARI
ncbi:LmeA family phospholipid-binding protein [Streptomyces sp. NPDC008343]|uniref:LmeA family phospholipid-binding protein n=1 Tax=Streptomyces sp. NPDC008343 TaxID=3364828 RepID=UPI0036E38663